MTCPAPRWLWDGFLPRWPCPQPLPTRPAERHGPCLLPEGGQRLTFKTLLLRSTPCARGTALTAVSTLLLLQALLCVGGRVPEVAAAGRGQGAVLRGTRQRGTSLPAGAVGQEPLSALCQPLAIISPNPSYRFCAVYLCLVLKGSPSVSLTSCLSLHFMPPYSCIMRNSNQPIPWLRPLTLTV